MDSLPILFGGSIFGVLFGIRVCSTLTGLMIGYIDPRWSCRTTRSERLRRCESGYAALLRFRKIRYRFRSVKRVPVYRRPVRSLSRVNLMLRTSGLL